MAGSKLSPRQKMINLLYVVLIAMMAINISGEVINGFIIANHDIEDNVAAQKELNSKITEAVANDSLKSAAMQLREKMLLMSGELDNIKNMIMEDAQKRSFSDNVKLDDDIQSVKNVMLGDKAMASYLKGKINELRQACIEMNPSEASVKVINNFLNTERERNSDKSWEEEHFADLPLVGAMMIINNIEKDMWLAVNETTGSIGTGIEEMPEVKEEEEEKEEIEFSDFKPMIVSEHKAPLYAGYENVLKVSPVSPLRQDSDVKLVASDGKVKKTANGYIVIPTGKDETITLSVKKGSKVLTELTYDVIELPMPKPVLVYTSASGKEREYRSSIPLGKKELQSISEIRLLAGKGVNNNEKISGFDMMVIKNGSNDATMIHADGYKLNADMKKALRGIENGDKVIFMNISSEGKFTGKRMLVSINVIHI